MTRRFRAALASAGHSMQPSQQAQIAQALGASAPPGTAAAETLAPPSARDLDKRPLARAGLVLGVGLGGFVDGILFHQIFQIHNMISARRPPDTVANIEAAMVWDGLFHAATWIVTATGVAMLFRAARRPEAVWSGRLLVGAMLLGWGAFNLAEGIIDHHILHVHHVVERLGVSIYDWAFLGSGIVFGVVGVVMMRTARMVGVTR